MKTITEYKHLVNYLMFHEILTVVLKSTVRYHQYVTYLKGLFRTDKEDLEWIRSLLGYDEEIPTSGGVRTKY